MSHDNIYILGATGNIGSHLVKGLIEAGVRTTIFARDEGKAKSLFEKEFKTGHLRVVQGDYENAEAFENSIAGHTRLFLLIAEIDKIPQIKGSWAKIAYDNGVKQVVDISSFTCNFYKVGLISYEHALGEEALLSVVGDNSLVLLRPGYFMSNHVTYDLHSIKHQSKLIGSSPPEYHVPCVDVRDIADVALNIFLDPIEKHGISIYNITPDPLTNLERAQIFSRVLGREITYVHDTIENVYNRLISFNVPHKFAYDLISVGLQDYSQSTPQITILTKKPIRRFEQWVQENKEKFL